MEKKYHFNFLEVHENKNLKSISITIHHQRKDKTITHEILYELENLIRIIFKRLDVSTLYIECENELFFEGLDPVYFNDMNELKKFTDRLRKWSLALLHLPQTTIVNYGKFVSKQGFELGLGADIRIAAENVKFNLDYLTSGQIPNTALGILNHLIPHGFLRSIILSNGELNSTLAQHLGIVQQVFNKMTKDDLVESLLTKISKQNSVSRIQAKKALLELLLPDIPRWSKIESTTALEGMNPAYWN